MNAIPVLAFVKRGVLVGHPEEIKVDWTELSKSKQNNDKTDGTDDDDSSDETSDNLEKLYNLNSYDSSDDEVKNPFADIAYHPNNAKDEYMDNNADDDAESEDAQIYEDDNIIAVGKVHGDYFSLECCVYNEGEGSLYCHNDMILNTFPLAMEWVGYDPGEDGPGNLVAIGGIEPEIHFWDLNVRNAIEPAFTLKSTAKMKGNKKRKMSQLGHTDAILDLSWNSLQGNALASASADHTIGLWDIEDGVMVTSITSHEDKVQSLVWHPFECETLLSGSMDHTVKVFDCRSAEATCKSWALKGEVERVIWNMHDPFYCLASTDTGHVCCIDIRADKLLYKWKAQNTPITGLAMSSEMPGCVVSASSDNLVKVWDIRDHKPEEVTSKDFKIGDIHCIKPCPDSGFVFALGGETQMRIYHLKTSNEILKRWGIEATHGSGQDEREDADSSSCSSDNDDDMDVEEIRAVLTGVEDTKTKKKKKKKKKNKVQSSSNMTSVKTNGDLASASLDKAKSEDIGEDSVQGKLKKKRKPKKKKKKGDLSLLDSDETHKQNLKKRTSNADLGDHSEISPDVSKSAPVNHSTMKKKKKLKSLSSDISQVGDSEIDSQKANKKKKKKRKSNSTVSVISEVKLQESDANITSQKKTKKKRKHSDL